jgi:hypothetical protein
MVLVPHVIEGFKSGLVKEYLRNSGLDYWKFLGLSLGSTSRSIQPFVDRIVLPYGIGCRRLIQSRYIQTKRRVE